MATSSLINTLPRSTCGKCVQVLKDLVAGLQEDENSDDPTKNHKNKQSKSEPPPLTLLKAIARSSRHNEKNRKLYDQWGQERNTQQRNNRKDQISTSQSRFANPSAAASAREEGVTAESIATSISNAVARSGVVATNHDPTDDTNKQQQDYGSVAAKQPLLRIEETEDGVRLIIPVETTKPASMKPWTKLEQEKRAETKISNKKGHNKTNELDYSEEDDWMLPLATSVRRDSRIARRLLGDNDNSTNTQNNTRKIEKPLEIELRCRRCESSGPEAGARAFLMGPEPLSIVLCHNRINAESDEVAEILTHELIHLYDVQTLQLDLSDCETVAYSEVRAAREAECGELGKDLAKVAESTKKSTFSKLQESFNNKVYKPYCVRNIALGATQNMFPREGKKCINKVWETAYGDHRPFGRTLQQKKERDTAASSRLYNTSSGTSHGTSDK